MPFGFVLKDNSPCTMKGETDKFVNPNNKNASVSKIVEQFKCNVIIFSAKMQSTVATISAARAVLSNTSVTVP